MSPSTKRAKPLSREERREAILAAVIPLLMEKGTAVTTAEMAAAAGIAEGTIFRAFPDKAGLLHEAVGAAMNPMPVQAALAGIPVDEPLEAQLTEAAEILARHFERIGALVGMLRSMPHPVEKPVGDAHRVGIESMAAITIALTAMLDRHRDRLKMEPVRVALALRGLVFVNTHPLLAADEKLTIPNIVDIVLHGTGEGEAT